MNTPDPISIWKQPLPAQLLQVFFGQADSNTFSTSLRTPETSHSHISPVRAD